MTRSGVNQKDDPTSSDANLRDEIDTLIKSSRMQIALDAINGALETRPDDSQILLRRGKVLRFLNRLSESETILQDLLKRTPDDHQIICELAATRRRLGDTEGSLALVTPVLEEDPNNQNARLEQIETLLAQGEGQAALSATEAGLAVVPESIDMRLIQARALQMAGLDEAAVAELHKLRAARPANPFVGFALAQALHHSGAFAEADEVYAELTESMPNFIRSWAGRIDLALEQNQTEAAAQICDEALIHNAGNRTLILLKCRVLQTQQRLDSAVALIKDALEQMPADEVLQTRLVQLLYLTGNPDAAAQIMTEAPAGMGLRNANLIARLNVAETRGEIAQAIADASQALGLTKNGFGDAPIPVDLGLKYCELALRADQTEHIITVIDHLMENIGQMQEGHLIRLFQLGERISYLDVPVLVIRETAKRHQIKPILAQFLMRRGQLVMPPEEAMGLADALQTRLAPRVQPEFGVFATALVAGPEAALRQARANIKTPATMAQAAALGQQILDAGRFALALRYLRRCMGRWPSERPLRQLFLRACSDVGNLAEGHRWLDRLKAENPQIDIDPDRVSLLVLGARHEEAIAICEARQARGLKTRAPAQLLELYLALGRYDEAVQMAVVLRGSSGVGRQTADHFGGTLLGARLKELALFKQEVAQLSAEGLAEADIDRKLAMSLFYPAKRIIDRWLSGTSPDTPLAPAIPDGPAHIPRHVVQYWNTPMPPEEVTNLMQSWQVDGIAHTLYDRLGALAFLRTHFGEKHVRAFVLANSVTEECDFLRLCLLYKFGGVYADADDRLIKPLDGLLAQGAGMIVMREMMGALSNNIICARAGHPVLKIAIALAGQSLLRRESDSTWTKTGPGLLSRAVAIYLHDTPEEESRRDLTIISSETLNRFVQPHVRLSYKSTSGYWNAKDGRVPGPIISALHDLTNTNAATHAAATE